VSERRQQIEYRRQEIQGESEDVQDDASAATALMGEVESDEAVVENRDDVAAVARELVAARRDLLNKLEQQLAARGVELEGLQDAYTDRREGLIPILRDALSYIEERILWVRSVSGPAIPSLEDDADAIRWLTSPGSWRAAIRSSWNAARFDLVRFSSIALGLVLLIAIRLRAPARLAYLNEQARSFRTDRFSLTVRALIVTMLMSLPIPAAARALAWFLDLPSDTSDLAHGVAGGLRAASSVMFALILARHVLRDDGVGARHFSWHNTGVRTIRRHLRWFIPTVSVLWGAAIALDVQSSSDSYGDSLGRMCFFGAMIALGLFLARILKPTGAVLGPIVKEHEGRWLDRLSVIWYSAAVGLPVVLIGLALAKYYYTALRLQHLLFATIWLVGALVLASALMGRWLFITRRRLAIESAKRRREQARAAALAEAEKNAASASPSAAAPPPPPPSAAVDPQEVDIPALDSKMRQAVRTGIGLAFLIGMVMIWSEVLPALKMLDRVQMWPKIAWLDAPPVSDANRQESDKSASASHDEANERGERTLMPGNPLMGTTSAETNDAQTASEVKEFRVTLGNVGMALLFGVITVLAVRNLPAVVELILLQHLPLDSASRYALVSVFRYALAIIGVTVTMGKMGISWSSIQWLAAALTFGLAFGLQEIFANFVSGLIILAERPIRVGDVVTVGDTEGSVTKIRMRATTVMGWDRKELIIPNKTFITDRVINWTLSDATQRIVVPVGVAYGSDLDKVERTLYEACRSVPESLEDPAPVVVYKGFGDSTLNWEARIYISSLEHLFPARTKLYKAIDMSFRREGIEIAFPQMDIHVRSSEELSEILRSGAIARSVAQEESAKMSRGGTEGPEGV
ncbi:MAG: mechanosensitive ion channel, partial [Phycisphaerales bacterium]|nr:mechanosensitive ion channel [Phycisphaerales bacterium]